MNAVSLVPALAGATRGLGRRVSRLLLAIGLVAAMPVALAAQAQTRTVSGRVTDLESREPLVGAQVLVKGTTVGTIAKDDGTFTLAAPVGDITLTVRRIGYPPTDVRVPAATSSIAVTLKKDVLNLSQVVVTGQASAIAKRNLPNMVATVGGDELNRVPSASVDQALQAKIAGAQIQQNTGAPGGGNRVRIRGISSILGNAQPLYVVDGVLVSDAGIGGGTNLVTRASGSSISVASQESPVNRIADFNPNDIENIEVLKGASASAIYGSKASGGVIIITTKRGQTGKPVFALRAGAGTARLSYREGSRRFRTLADATERFGASAAQYYDASRVIDYEDIVYGNKPANSEISLSASGGNENTKFYASGLMRKEDGIVANTYNDKYSLRLNLDQVLSQKMTTSISSEIIRNDGDRGLFGNDNAGNSIAYALTKIPSFLDLRRLPDGSYPTNPFYNSNPLQTIDLFKNGESVWRTLNSVKLNYSAFSREKHQLHLMAVAGMDHFAQRNNIYSPAELQYEADDGLLGTAAVSYTQNTQANLNINAVHTWTPSSAYLITSQVGTQFEKRSFDQARGGGQNLVGNLPVVSAGTVRSVEESRFNVTDLGIFAQSEVLVRERLLLTAGFRADRSSNNGDPSQFYVFPKVSASYRIPNLVKGWVDEAKLRVAFGETGNQPQFDQRFTALTTGNITGIPIFLPAGARGTPDIRPERQREIEFGTDLVLFDSRATLELTSFRRDISDLLITRTLAPSTGYSSESSNGAALRVTGIEAAASYIPVRTKQVTWTSRLNFGQNRSEITDLPVPSFLLSSPQVGAIRIKKGESATTLIGNDTLPNGTTTTVVMGDGNPKWNGSLGNDVRIGRFGVYALLEHQEGGMLAAGTWRHYDLGFNSRDFDDAGPGGARLGDFRRKNYLRVTRIYYQDATATRLREVTLSWDIPNGVAHALWGRLQSPRLSLSGRNLVLWTKYRGGDPDYANFGGTPESVQRNRELASYPPSRTFWLNLSLGF